MRERLQLLLACKVVGVAGKPEVPIACTGLQIRALEIRVISG